MRILAAVGYRIAQVMPRCDYAAPLLTFAAVLPEIFAPPALCRGGLPMQSIPRKIGLYCGERHAI